jgi:hypothetical protein
MSTNLLPYSLPSGAVPPVNQSFTVVNNEAASQSLLESSNVNISNDLNVSDSINGLMPIKTSIGYTPTEFCKNTSSGEVDCWFLMTEPNKSMTQEEFRLQMPEKSFFFQGVMSNYDQRIKTTLVSTQTETVAGDTTETGTTVNEGPKNPYTFPTLGFDVGYGPVEKTASQTLPCCSSWPSTTQALFRCASDDSVNAGVAVTSTNSDGLKGASTGVLNTQNAALSTPGTVGAPADQFCTISICNDADTSWSLSSGGIVVCLSYWEIPFVPCDTPTIVTPGVQSSSTNQPRAQPSRNTASRAAFASTL